MENVGKNVGLRRLSGLTLVEAVERGRDLSPTERALAMLSAVLPHKSRQQLSRLRLGERDRLLLLMRQAILGPTFNAGVTCPACGTPREFSVDVEDILAQDAAVADMDLEIEGYALRLRPLDSRDLEAIAGLDVETARLRLLQKVVLQATSADGEVAPESLPPTVMAAINERLEAIDPLALVPLALACEFCGHPWEPIFDIARYLWDELEAAVDRLLYEVHTLAQVYGWTEAEILAMSSYRRRYYLDRTPTGKSPKTNGAGPQPQAPSQPPPETYATETFR